MPTPRPPGGVAMLVVAIVLSTSSSTASASATPPPGTGPAASSGPPFRAHAYFDDTRGVPQPGLHPGAPVTSAPAPRRVTGPDGSHREVAGSGLGREVLGFAQAGEIGGGSWQGDLRLDLLTTVAYFGVNVNGDGSLTTADNGYVTWRSSAATAFMNAAHAAGVRVVLTVKAFDDPTIAAIVGSEANRQRCIAAVVAELQQRGGDGVNVDFEGYTRSVASTFTTFVAELHDALHARVPGRSYLTVDTFATAAQGGTMFDIPGLAAHLDAFDVMAYEFTSSVSASRAGPVAPLHGDWYDVTRTVQDYLRLVPASQVILGVPYYGNKWSTSSAQPEAGVTCCGGADTYSSVIDDLSCAMQLQRHVDATFVEPWASWWSPASGDPCGGNHGSVRELYYEDSAALAAKYDLVKQRGLRGVGIWALGYDSGHAELWNTIGAAFAGPGYWMAGADGSIYPFGSAGSWGSMAGHPLNRPVVGMAAAPDGRGYWLVASDGGIFPNGSARGLGSTGGIHLNSPIVGMAATGDGAGYWLVAADGGVFPFGDACGCGSMGGRHLNRPIVGMAASPRGHGYWLVASDGGIFVFGDARGGLGSTGGIHLNKPILGMASTHDGGGYWLVASDGGIFPFGDATRGLGSTGGIHLNQPITGMAATADGRGYWLVAADGGVFPFGDAPGLGSMGWATLPAAVVAITRLH